MINENNYNYYIQSNQPQYMSSIYSEYEEDDSLDVLQDILPQIEEKIAISVFEEEEMKMKKQLEKSFNLIQKQAKKQFAQALKQLQEESQNLKHQQIMNLKKEVQQLKRENQEMFHKHEEKLKKQFTEEILKGGIIHHPKFSQIEEDLVKQLFFAHEERFILEKKRKMKEMMIKFENKKLKENEERNRKIRQSVYARSGIKQEKKKIEQLLAEIGSMKSKYNLKMNKLNSQINAQKFQNKQIQAKKQNISNLKAEYQILKQRKEQFKKKQQNFKQNLPIQNEQTHKQITELPSKFVSIEKSEEYGESILDLNVSLLLRQELKSIKNSQTNRTSKTSRNSSKSFRERYDAELKKMGSKKSSKRVMLGRIG